MAIFAILILVLSAMTYGFYSYFDATGNAAKLKSRADSLISQSKGPDALGNKRAAQLLMVQDPSYYDHNGVDLTSKGAGVTTLTQSLAKRIGFSEFKPGIAKLRQTAYALGLESELSKEQIFALFLDTVEMGKGPDGWMTGFFNASRVIYDKEVDQLSDQDFLSLVAVMIAPATYDLRKPLTNEYNEELTERVTRIKKLTSGKCKPEGLRDVWLDGCK